MKNQKEKRPIAPWRVAYLARELRHKKEVTLSCLKSEKDFLIHELCSFSNSSPLDTKMVNKPNSREIYLEIKSLI